MDTQKLQAANSLEMQIKSVSSRLQKWEAATSFGNNGIYINWADGTRKDISWEASSPETFTVVKALNIQHWQAELNRLEKEFTEL